MTWAKNKYSQKSYSIYGKQNLCLVLFLRCFFRYISEVLGFIFTRVEKHKLRRDSLSDLCENVNEIEH